ncbi:MAG: FprA family A-type flavoprotein [Armatimonadetes bacterium]|nr:FprA family A-type flavoprotein [Armatimonadota bacterium]
MAVSVTDNVSWLGVIDWNVRDFHGYRTERGSTYNSYLLRGEKTAVIDTVKAPFADELIAAVEDAAGCANVDYIVVNHAEPDHSGALPRLLQACPQASVVCDEKCAEILGAYYDTSTWEFQIVATGDTLDLGGRTLTFLEVPMVHWPESMVSYCPEERILFSNDAFGQHYASSYRFDDGDDLPVIMDEARTYYANIVMLYGKQIARALEAASELDIEIICPSHGVIWREHVADILAAYTGWVKFRPQAKVLIVYSSMWHSTELMARALAEGAARDGVTVKLFDVAGISRTVLATETLDAAVLAVGSPTLNKTLMPDIAALLTYLKGLSPKNKSGLAFGSCGWAPSGPNDVNAYLEEMKFDILREPLTCRWKPTADVLAECREAGVLLADRALQAVAEED